MGHDLHGYVEVKSGHNWNAVIDLSYLGRWVEVQEAWAQIATYEMDNGEISVRSIPESGEKDAASLSAQVRREALGLEGFAHSWITYTEMKNAQIDYQQWRDYRVLIQMCDILSDAYSPEKIRIIFWFV